MSVAPVGAFRGPAVYMCLQHEDKLYEWARAMGYFDGGQLELIKTEAAQAKTELEAAKAELKSLKAQRASVKRSQAMTLRQMTEESSMVYVFQRQSDGLIKIGVTVNVQGRIRTHITEHGPIELLGLIQGTKELEGQMHARFAEHLAEKREWFHPHPDVMEWAKTLPFRPRATKQDA